MTRSQKASGLWIFIGIGLFFRNRIIDQKIQIPPLIPIDPKDPEPWIPRVGFGPPLVDSIVITFTKMLKFHR